MYEAKVCVKPELQEFFHTGDATTSFTTSDHGGGVPVWRNSCTSLNWSHGLT